MGSPAPETGTNRPLLELDVDVPIPVAIGNVLTEPNDGDAQAAIVIEGANGPTTRWRRSAPMRLDPSLSTV